MRKRKEKRKSEFPNRSQTYDIVLHCNIFLCELEGSRDGAEMLMTYESLPIEFAVGSCLCTKGFSPGTSVFLPSTRTKIPKFQLELETVDELSRSVEATYHEIPIYLFTATPDKFNCNFDTPNSICLNLLNSSYTHLCTR